MFRKVSHIVVSLLLLTSTMGLTLSAHYCGENLKSISFAGDSESCCDIPQGCCHDEAGTFRIDDDFDSMSLKFDTKLVASLIMAYSNPIFDELSARDFQIISFIEPPPPTVLQLLSRIQVYVL